MSGLGRTIPADWGHVDNHPARLRGASGPVETPATVRLSDALRAFYNQGDSPQCVAFSQCIAASLLSGNKERFDAPELFGAIHALEGITDPNVGADVRDGFQVMMTRGPKETKPQAGIDVSDGPASYSWCRSMNDARDALAALHVVVFGINWYAAFDSPRKFGSEYWIGRGVDLGSVRGGHAICALRWSDRRQAFQFTNSWGRGYPRVWVPVAVGERLLKEDGEAGFGIPRDAAVRMAMIPKKPGGISPQGGD